MVGTLIFNAQFNEICSLQNIPITFLKMYLLVVSEEKMYHGNIFK